MTNIDSGFAVTFPNNIQQQLSSSQDKRLGAIETKVAENSEKLDKILQSLHQVPSIKKPSNQIADRKITREREQKGQDSYLNTFKQISDASEREKVLLDTDVRIFYPEIMPRSGVQEYLAGEGPQQWNLKEMLDTPFTDASDIDQKMEHFNMMRDSLSALYNLFNKLELNTKTLDDSALAKSLYNFKVIDSYKKILSLHP